MKKVLILAVFLTGSVFGVALGYDTISDIKNTSDNIAMYYDYPYSYSDKNFIIKITKRVNDLFAGTENENSSRFELANQLYPLTGKDRYGNDERIKALIEEIMIQILPKQSYTKGESRLSWLYNNEGNGLLDQSVAYGGSIELEGYIISRNQITTSGYNKMMDSDYLTYNDINSVNLPLFFVPTSVEDGLELSNHPYLRWNIDLPHRYLIEDGLLLDQYKYEYYDPLYKKSIFIGCLDQFSLGNRDKLFSSSKESPIGIVLNYSFPHKYPYDHRMDDRGGPMQGWEAVNHCININKGIIVK